MIDQRTQFMIQVLEKIGGPLSSAIAAGPVLDNESSDAQRLAELLNRSVQLGLSVAGEMNVRDESQADGVHLSLAAFASPLLAAQYLVTGKVPPEEDVQRMTTALLSVLAFADNFIPAADSTLRIQNSEAGSQPADESLVYVQVLTSFAPVLQAVGDYTFGIPENKLIQQITTRLMKACSALRFELFGEDLSIKGRHQVDIVLMKLLCGIYAACHSAEMRRLVNLSDTDRAKANITIEPVWAAFDKQATMVKIIAEQLIPGGKIADGKVGSAAVKLLNQTKKDAEAAKAQDKQPASAGAGANPMAFFGKTPKPAANAAPDSKGPPAAIAALGKKPLTAKKKSASTEAAAPAEASDNPMAFFAKKKKSDE